MTLTWALFVETWAAHLDLFVLKTDKKNHVKSVYGYMAKITLSKWFGVPSEKEAYSERGLLPVGANSFLSK